MLRCRAPPLLTVRMSSSSSLSSSPPFPPPSIFPNPSPRLSSSVRAYSRIPKPSRRPSFADAAKMALVDSQNLMTLSSRCLPGSADPIPISSTPEIRNSAELECDGSDLKALVVVSFYKFADFPDHGRMRQPLKKLCEELRVSGGIILAPEGINGSLCGTRESVERVLGFIQSDDRLKGLRRVESPVSPEEEAIHHGHSSSSPLAAGEDAPFRWDHVRVKLKKEIVTLGMPSISPTEKVGKYVSPREWNQLISDPDTVE